MRIRTFFWHVCTGDHLKKINVTDKWDTILDSPGHGESKMTHFKINFVRPFLLHKITVKNTAKSEVYYLKMSFLTNLLQWTDKVDFKTHHFGIPMTWEVQNCISLASNIYLCQTSSGAYVSITLCVKNTSIWVNYVMRWGNPLLVGLSEAISSTTMAFTFAQYRSQDSEDEWPSRENRSKGGKNKGLCSVTINEIYLSQSLNQPQKLNCIRSSY